jgi:hypothetical protein
MSNSSQICKICGMSSDVFGHADVLKKYKVQFFRCAKCGFIQTEKAYWLEEAYSSAIAAQDVGIMQRNLENCRITSAVLSLLFPTLSSALDFGAGHGIFVRMMRDRGFNFSWSDLYATNDYARGFEKEEGKTYDFVTAFEVLEHLTEPISTLSELMSSSDNLFVSTCLVPQPTPPVPDWWYYMPSSGQHISFYTHASLRVLADRFGKHLLSVGDYHLFSREPKKAALYGLAMNRRFAGLINRFNRRSGLTEMDFRRMIRE